MRPTETVLDLQQKIQEKTKLPPGDQNLFFRGKLVGRTGTLADNDIVDRGKNPATIHVVNNKGVERKEAKCDPKLGLIAHTIGLFRTCRPEISRTNRSDRHICPIRM